LTVIVVEPAGSELHWADRWRSASSQIRLVSLLVLGVVAATVTGILGSWKYAPLIGWDVAAAFFCVSVWAAIGGMDPAETAEYASREDPGRASSGALLLAASVASLAAVAVVWCPPARLMARGNGCWPAWRWGAWRCPGC
jgi:uncharacterized membrane protein